MKNIVEFIRKYWLVIILIAFAISIPIENAYRVHAEALDWELTEGKIYRLESGWQFIDEHRMEDKLDPVFARVFPDFIRKDNLGAMEIISLIYTGTCHPESERGI